jgi:hypothetical protein
MSHLYRLVSGIIARVGKTDKINVTGDIFVFLRIEEHTRLSCHVIHKLIHVVYKLEIIQQLIESVEDLEDLKGR